MLVVKVELHSAITGMVTEIGRTYIANDGTGTRDEGNYKVSVQADDAIGETYRGWDFITASRKAEVKGYLHILPVWHLITRALMAAYPEEVKPSLQQPSTQ